MEEELKEAIALYKSNLAELSEAEALQDQTTSAATELAELKAQLEQGIKDAEEALTALAPSTTNPTRTTDPTRGGWANNARINPRSHYATQEPDFAALARLYPSLQPYLIPGKTATSRPTIDFTNFNACRQLTQVLLQHDFNIHNWWVPDNQLIPPVTNRLNYIHWLQDLIELSSPSPPFSTTTGNNNGTIGTTIVTTNTSSTSNAGIKGTSISGSEVVGLDIGCGANCIYPLLGAAVYGWTFVGVDVSDVAVQWAVRNRNENEGLLKGLIEVRRVEMQPEQAEFFTNLGKDTQTTETEQQTTTTTRTNRIGKGILSGAIHPNEHFTFCMCNPPFFESIQESNTNPTTAYAGTPTEMIFPGGELSFVTQIVEDSMCLPANTIHWYTTMVGKKSTMKAVRGLLYKRGVKVVRTTEFFQGKTSRWGVAWSLCADVDVVNKPLVRSGGGGLSSKSGGKGNKQQQQQKQQDGGGGGVDVGINKTTAIIKRKRSGKTRGLQIKAPDSAAPHILQLIQQSLQTYSQQNQPQLQIQVDAATYTVTVTSLSSSPNTTGSGTASNNTMELKVYMQNAGLFGVTASINTTSTSTSKSVVVVAAVNAFHAAMDIVEESIRSVYKLVV